MAGKDCQKRLEQAEFVERAILGEHRDAKKKVESYFEALHAKLFQKEKEMLTALRDHEEEALKQLEKKTFEWKQTKKAKKAKHFPKAQSQNLFLIFPPVCLETVSIHQEKEEILFEATNASKSEVRKEGEHVYKIFARTFRGTRKRCGGDVWKVFSLEPKPYLLNPVRKLVECKIVDHLNGSYTFEFAFASGLEVRLLAGALETPINDTSLKNLFPVCLMEKCSVCGKILTVKETKQKKEERKEGWQLRNLAKACSETCRKLMPVFLIFEDLLFDREKCWAGAHLKNLCASTRRMDLGFLRFQ